MPDVRVTFTKIPVVGETISITIGNNLQTVGPITKVELLKSPNVYRVLTQDGYMLYGPVGNAPLGTTPMNPLTAAVVIIGIFIFVWILMASSGTPQAERSQENAAEKNARAVIASRRFVEQYLKCPATAKFPNAYDVSVTNVGNEYTVDSYVDSQNSFGALIRSTYSATLTYAGPGEYDFSMESLTIDGQDMLKGTTN